MVLPLPWGRGVIVCGAADRRAAEGWQSGLPTIAAALTDAADLADRLCAMMLRTGLRRGHPAAAPALRAVLRWRARAGRRSPAACAERRGIEATPRPAGPLLWLHAASVGETVSVLPVLSALATRAHATVLLTTGTVTSAALLARRLPELGLERRVLHRFVPLDVPAWTGRFLAHWRPDAAGFVVAAGLLRLATTLEAGAPLPPQDELRDITVVSLDLRVYAFDGVRPDPIPQPKLAAMLAAHVRQALTGAKIQIAEQPLAVVPRLIVQLDLVRTPAAPGFVAVGSRIEYSDRVLLQRRRGDRPAYHAALWSDHQTDLVAEPEIEDSVWRMVANGVERFLYARRSAEHLRSVRDK